MIYLLDKKGIGTIAPRGKFPPPVRVGIWVKVRVSFRVWGVTRQLPQRKVFSRLGLGFGLELVLGLEEIKLS